MPLLALPLTRQSEDSPGIECVFATSIIHHECGQQLAFGPSTLSPMHRGVNQYERRVLILVRHRCILVTFSAFRTVLVVVERAL